MELTPLRVTDGSDFALLGEIDLYESLQWTRRWQKPGEATLVMNYNLPYAGVLQRGNILEYGDLRAIIDTVSVKQDEGGKGKEMLTVHAKSCASIIGRAVTLPPAGLAYDVKAGATETVMKTFVSHKFATIPALVVAEDRLRGIHSAWQTRLDALADLLEQMSIVTGLGWDVWVDTGNQRYVFEVYEGVVRTNGSPNPVIFNPDYDNLRTQSYEESDADYKNVAIVAGQGEGVDRLIIEVSIGAPTGLDRREIFVDARDLELEADLIVRGQQTLAGYPIRRTLSAEILTKATTEYKKDWDLGDIVVVENTGWGVSMDAQVIEVTEVIQQSGRQLTAVFGTGQLRLSQAIKRQTAMAEKEVKK